MPHDDSPIEALAAARAHKPASPALVDDLDATLERVALADVRPHPRNYQDHPDSEITHLMQSLTLHGVYKNVVIAQDSTLLAGHGVVEAARRLGYTHLTMKRMPYGPDEPQALQLLVGDNEIAREVLKNDQMLTALLEELRADDPAQLLGTGFDEAMLDALAEAQGLGNGTGEAGRDVEPQMDRAEGLREKWGVEVGQLWQTGVHRIMCGDCTDKAVVERLMEGMQAALCHADPPYGMGKEAEGIANDNLYASKLDAFQMRWWQACRASLAANASGYIWGTAEDLWRLWYVGGLRGSERLTFRNELVWDKGDAGAGGISHQGAEGLRLYPHATERCLFFMLGEQGFNTNADNYWEGWEPIRAYLWGECQKVGLTTSTAYNTALGLKTSGGGMFAHHVSPTGSQWLFLTREHYETLQRYARGDGFKRDYDDLKRDYDDLKRDYYATRAYFDNTHDNMTDVWHYPRVKGEERHGHPTPKPVALIERMILSSTPLGSLVYEPFLGSGTTLVACENLGRTCYGCELDPGYVAVTLQRYQDLTGDTSQRLA